MSCHNHARRATWLWLPRPFPPRFVKRPPFEFGDWSGVDYPCVGVNGDVCSLGTSSLPLSAASYHAIPRKKLEP